MSITQLNDGKVHIAIMADHNHGQNASKLKISAGLRANIKLRFSAGVSIDVIMEQHNLEYWSLQAVNGNIDCLPRDAYLSRKDVYNICYSLDQIHGQLKKRHSNDAIAVSSLVAAANARAKKYSYDIPFHLFKTDTQAVPAKYKDFIAKDEWAICLATHRMRDLYEKYGETIMVDSTHNTTAYKYQLLTLMVMDHGGHGLPICHFVYKSECTGAYKAMFTILKDLDPEVIPKHLMTDCNVSAFNAFCSIYG